MKYLLVLGVVFFALWLWRHNRETEAREKEATRPRPTPQRPGTPTVTHMVACLHCGLHLPQADAVTGHRGQYCSQAHRQAREG